MQYVISFQECRTRICDTLIESSNFPRTFLSSNTRLMAYINKCAEITWLFCVQDPPLVLGYVTKTQEGTSITNIGICFENKGLSIVQFVIHLDAHAQPLGKDRDEVRLSLALWLKLPLAQCSVCADREGSSETAQVHGLTWAFDVRLCDKYPF